MKKFLSSMLGSLVTHTILLLLVLSVLTENENLASIAISVNWVLVVLGWLTFSVAICLMAYTGWVVSAVIYGITSFLFTLGASIARDKIEEYKAA
ncbi:hypothetical protein S969_000031 [Salmonella enterica subsp. salamae serovar 6,7:z:1,5]|nr:hypothetical protein [Salmonella enterica subsp. salamae serovar 6,7:z:1,5]EHA0428168.1 hypothetical protein [Salmonella enterica subsp. enterica serovar Muenchen]